MTYQYLVSYAYRVMVLGEADEEGNREYKEEFEGSARTYIDLTSKLNSPKMVRDLEATLLTDIIKNDLEKNFPAGTTFEISTMLTAATYLCKFRGKPGSRFIENASPQVMMNRPSPAPSIANESVNENTASPSPEGE